MFEHHNNNNNVRQPLCNYYSSDADTLKREIDWCRRYYGSPSCEAAAPAADPAVVVEQQQHHIQHQQTPPPASILLVPHGAFCDSGPLVAEALAHCLLSSSSSSSSPAIIDTVLLIGTEHASGSRYRICCSDHAQWRTPLGDVPVNSALLEAVKESTGVPVDNAAFAEEHSVENQLPFLQSILLQPRRPWSMVALSVHGSVDRSDLSLIADTGEKLASVLQNYGSSRVAVIATTDYTHAGPFYGELPPASSRITIPEYIRSRDLPFLHFLCDGSELPTRMEDVWERGRQISMCGLGATLLVMVLAKNLGRRRARLLRYAVGSDICERGLQDQTGFATIVFE